MLMIDPHVHLRDWSQSSKETLVHGMTAGVRAGIGTFFDMPNTSPALTDRATILKRLADGEAASRSVAEATGILPSYHVYGGVTAEAGQVTVMASIVQELFPKVVGLKMFAGHSTGNMGLVTEDLQRRVYRELAKAGYRGVLAVHCEKEALLHPESWNPAVPASHSLARPVSAEIESVRDQLRFATETGFQGTLHVCHVSTAGALELIRCAKVSGLPFSVTCGATAHHALLSESAYDVSGNLVKMNPPLRDERDRIAVFNGLLDGCVDWVESDHAPHTMADKREGASGIPGFSGTLLLARALRRAGCSPRRLEEVFGRKVGEMFRLPCSGRIEIPDDSEIERILPALNGMYPWNPYCSLS
jgi:dihydroorotase